MKYLVLASGAAIALFDLDPPFDVDDGDIDIRDVSKIAARVFFTCD